MKRILYIDDDTVSLKRMERFISEHFPDMETVTCQDPIKALTLIEPTLALLIIDLEMPRLDGRKLLKYAIDRGVEKKKIVILSGREADYLHEIFPMGECLCVLNKYEQAQQKVLEMVLSSIHKK